MVSINTMMLLAALCLLNMPPGYCKEGIYINFNCTIRCIIKFNQMVISLYYAEK